MDIHIQKQEAADFLMLHQGPRILVPPNAWNATSARILEQTGFPAIGTTIAGVAYSLGYPARATRQSLRRKKIPYAESKQAVFKVSSARYRVMLHACER